MKRIIVSDVEPSDMKALHAELSALGYIIISSLYYENYDGLGPSIVLDIDMPENDPDPILKPIIEQLESTRPVTSKESFVVIASPDGKLWNVGVTNLGVVRVLPRDPEVK